MMTQIQICGPIVVTRHVLLTSPTSLWRIR